MASIRNYVRGQPSVEASLPSRPSIPVSSHEDVRGRKRMGGKNQFSEMALLERLHSSKV